MSSDDLICSAGVIMTRRLPLATSLLSLVQVCGGNAFDLLSAKNDNETYKNWTQGEECRCATMT